MTAGRLAAALVAALVLFPAPAAAEVVPDRTLRVSLGANGSEGDGDARHAAISGDGTRVAFDSDATTLTLDENGAVRDVFVRDLAGNVTSLISRAPGGPPADGPSTFPALSEEGATVAFTSGATNLVTADGNGLDDVFVRAGDRIVRVSVAADGGDANGPSGEADISADGRFVVFSSTASNILLDDPADHSDVFVHDLLTGSTRLVSNASGAPADGDSRAPAISPDGRYVSFYSEAPDLLEGDDDNGVGDVFRTDLRTGRVRIMSVSSGERPQDRSVEPPFVQVSDVSRRGRYVAFDSDARTLVEGDTNRSTDVFVRDVERGRTSRVSFDRRGRQGDNDSFYPTITPNGRWIAFESFARGFTAFDGPDEDLFVRDRRLRVTSVLGVPSRGGVKRRERVRQLLQRPAVSDDAQRAAFSSTAGNLTVGDDNERQDVFARILTPPRARIRGLGAVTSSRGRFRLLMDDAAAGGFHCSLDGRPFRCGARGRLPGARRGRHVLRVRAGGRGTLYGPPATRRFRVR